MFPTFAELSSYQNHYPYVPVAFSFKVADLDELKLVNYLDQQGNTMYFKGGNHALGNYSYFITQPQFSLKLLDGKLQLTDDQGHKQVLEIEPHQYLTNLLKKYRQPLFEQLPPFAGGLIGYFSYEYTKYYQNHVAFYQENPNQLQDFGLFCCLQVIVYDHQHQELILIQDLATADLQQEYQKAQSKLSRFKKQILEALDQPLKLPSIKLAAPFKMRFTPAEFVQKVGLAKDHIFKGDIFQLIMSNPHFGQLTGSLLPILQQLIVDEPHAYHLYFKQDDFSAVAASPETLVTKNKLQLAGYPLAGTRKLTGEKLKDQQRIKELISSPKELAEHNMLVDLGRNDLGQVSQFGTVKVVKHAYLEKFETVVHLASTIQSQADPQKDLLDILEAVFPAGTLSGAPKTRAIQLIDKLEHLKHGLYGGAFGFLSFSGQMDLAIGIRLLHKTGQAACIHTGAGIVSDSIATNEYQECINKARSVKLAVQEVLQKEEQHGTLIR